MGYIIVRQGQQEDAQYADIGDTEGVYGCRAPFDSAGNHRPAQAELRRRVRPPLHSQQYPLPPRHGLRDCHGAGMLSGRA